MNSCLYECHIMHARLSPRRHQFAYRIFLFALDLDELDLLHRQLSPFSLERANLYSFRDADFLPCHEPLHQGGSPGVAGASGLSGGSPPAPGTGVDRAPAPQLKQRVMDHAARHGVDLTGGRVVLVTLPRVLGYLFNPVSFYFCYNRDGQPVAAIAEVTNTFREMKPYFLGPGTQSAVRGGFRLRLPKHFYVSPYSDVDVAFDFTLRRPGQDLSIRIDDFIGSERTLTTMLTGRRQPLTSWRLLRFTAKYPLITFRIIALIHWHAFLLWLKRVPWFAKQARAADQHELYRPHESLLQASPSDPA
jgi:DUF1365 family protein